MTTTSNDHPRRCKAKSSRTGEQCKRWAATGAEICPSHGAAAPQVKAKIERTRIETEARLAVELWGGRRDVHPAEALLELTQTKAMEVEFWRTRVHQIQQTDEAALTFGTTKVKDGGDDRGTTREAKPHVSLVLLHKAEAQLAEFSAAALKAGVDERLVRIAESTAGQFRHVIEQVLSDERLGITADPALRAAVGADALRRGVES